MTEAAVNKSVGKEQRPLNIFKASAGSGKTYTLVHRYLDLLLSDGLEGGYKRILVATFTNKATTELRERIVKELYEISLNGRKQEKGAPKKTPQQIDKEKSKAREVLEEILLDYESLRVQTIDSFFQEIVRTFVIELENSSANAEVALDRDGAIEMSVDRLLLNQESNVFTRLGSVLLSRVEEGDSTDVRAAIINLAKEMLYNPQADKYSIQALDPKDIDLAAMELKAKAEEALSEMEKSWRIVAPMPRWHSIGMGRLRCRWIASF
ncbi:UvrD-helicase domain-containing protein [uncultured Porphyromonas sp.]|uniref:UvrD-helicase domain-containing protein n=1 Tax=uncultured Porphyromonas sp. TaxID=159274 RepID=UPI00259BBB6E|nr:UvrD-helicase domain-containing protein [uncultured Porphyromonas sp.]